MTRIILIFGSLSGLIVSALMVLGFTLLSGEHGGASEAFGYLTMLLALAFIFLAIKRHRDINLGGAIKFWPALALGLCVAALAGVFYTITWEAYFNLSGGAFMEAYMAGQIEAQRAAGASDADIAAFQASMQGFADLYANWWFRMPMTFAEIFPVGVLVSLVSAILLRNPRLLPRTA
ncbi:DUF4199 domain-containing protein [Maricaulis parjimensis]|uniref:DUF4199 domain-containing protein n=1 Tax=Maricaulis parjimensis TaxID=144023 RepID=UPI0019392BFF|nr:DUF4199 domain-containing protein [Maricaulis parjimensis]